MQPQKAVRVAQYRRFQSFYRQTATCWEAGSNVLKDLGVPYPRIAWKLFRDCLIHGDELVAVIHDESSKYAGWEINLDAGHTKEPLKNRIDVAKIYENLLVYLDKQIALANDTNELCLGAIRITEEQQQERPGLRQEVQELFGLPPST
jgi:hypothetical protein